MTEETEVTGIGNDIHDKKPSLDVKTVKRSSKVEDIKCELTDEERTSKGSEVARIHRKIQLLEEEKKQTSDHFAGLIKEQKLSLNRCADAINNGYEFRSVVVETVIDYKQGTVTKRRTDTGYEIEHRKLTNAEARIEIEITDNTDKVKLDDEPLPECAAMVDKLVVETPKPKKPKKK